MQVIHYLNETNILIFLIQIFILLSCAKNLGTLLTQKGYPALVGEIITGIILGPTILGRFLPGIHVMIFPADLAQQNMLETVSWFGVLFLLLVTGFEVSISSVWKQGKASLAIGVIGVIVPLAIGIASFMWIPSRYYGENADQITFTLFMATAASISAIAIIARVLYDLDILKTDFGLVTLSAFAVNDILGWFIFTLVLGLTVTGTSNYKDLLHSLFEIILFTALCLSVGSRLVSVITRFLKKLKIPQTATILTFITLMAVLCGIITQWIGLHAILGFFLAGIMAGNTQEISEHTRDIISQMVYAVFVPIFFTTIGIKIDFIANFNLLLIIIFLAVAVIGKFVGALLGSKTVRFTPKESVSTGIAFIPGGAMEIVVAMLALEVKIIGKEAFVAIVFAAVVSSVMVGPLLAWSLKRKIEKSILNFLNKNSIIENLKGTDRLSVIMELCQVCTAGGVKQSANELYNLAKAREDIMGTAIGNGIAIPHVRIDNLSVPFIAYGLSSQGIEWDSPDGLPVKHIFFIATSLSEPDSQLTIVSRLAKIMSHKEVLAKIEASSGKEAVYNTLREAQELLSAQKPAVIPSPSRL